MDKNSETLIEQKLLQCSKRQRALSRRLSLFAPLLLAVAAAGGTFTIIFLYSFNADESDYERFTANELRVSEWVEGRLRDKESLVPSHSESLRLKEVRMNGGKGSDTGSLAATDGGGVEFVTKSPKGRVLMRMGVDADGNGYFSSFGRKSRSSIKVAARSDGASVKVCNGPKFPEVAMGTVASNPDAVASAFFAVRHPDGTELLESSTNDPGRLTLRRSKSAAEYSVLPK